MSRLDNALRTSRQEQTALRPQEAAALYSRRVPKSKFFPISVQLGFAGLVGSAAGAALGEAEIIRISGTRR
jgi:hypothetical protein